MTDRDARSLPQRVLDLWVAYLKGQFIVSASIGALTWIVGAAIGLPYAGVLGVLAGALEVIPSVGPLIAVLPAAIIALWQGSFVLAVENWVFCLIVIGAYVGVQQIGNLFIQPQVMSRELRLPPLLVLVCVLAGAAVGGVVGALLAAPLAATVKEVIDYFLSRRKS